MSVWGELSRELRQSGKAGCVAKLLCRHISLTLAAGTSGADRKTYSISGLYWIKINLFIPFSLSRFLYRVFLFLNRNRSKIYMPISTSRVPPCGPQVILQEWREGDTHSLDAARRTCPVAHRLFTWKIKHTHTHTHTHKHLLTSERTSNTQTLLVITSFMIKTCTAVFPHLTVVLLIKNML